MIANRNNVKLVPAAVANSPTTRRTPAQQRWIRLFEEQSILRSYRQNLAVPTSLPPIGVYPPVGGDYDFVETQTWPHNIVHIVNNVFSVSRPYPASKRSSSYRYDDGCEGNHCLIGHGVRTKSSCINVNMDIVCDDSNCFVGSTCGNRMQQRYVLDLISTRVGLGVFCDVTIPKDAFIVEYVGKVLLGPDAEARTDKRYHVKMKAKRSWEGPADVFIDAAKCGNESRFINHSCSPNCGLFDVEWANTSRLGIYAKTDIPPLRELTFRYRESKLTLFTCQCGQTNCVSKCS